MKNLAVKFKDLKDVNNAGFPWLLLGVLYFLFSFVGGVGDWTFFLTLLFGMGFVSVSLLLYQKKAPVLSGLLAAVIPVVGVVSSLGHVDMLVGVVLGTVLFGLFLAIELNLYKISDTSAKARFFAVAPLLLWMVWSGLYVWDRIALDVVGLATLLNVAGVFVVSVDGVLGFFGVPKKKNLQWLKWLGLLLVCVALVLNWGFGWSLSLVG